MSARRPRPAALLLGLTYLSLTLVCGNALAAAAKTAPLENARAALRLRDYPTALSRLQQLAGSGNAEAQLLLGLTHLNGVGGPVDGAQAESWLRKSAAQNNATAAYVLASVLAHQAGANADEAKILLHQAAKLGYPAAIEDVRLDALH